MTRMSLKFSEKNDLVGLARLVRALQAVAQPRDVDFFLMGAAARDLMLRHAHGINAARLTEDADFAVMVGDWRSFEDLRAGLIASGEFWIVKVSTAWHRSTLTCLKVMTSTMWRPAYGSLPVMLHCSSVPRVWNGS